MSKRAPVCILEGTWWSNHEVPLILPYFHALATSHREIDLSHRTIRGADDIAYYVRRSRATRGHFSTLPAMGSGSGFRPPMAVRRFRPRDCSRPWRRRKPARLRSCTSGAARWSRRRHAARPMRRSRRRPGARWVSGYTTPVDWLQSTLLDIALVSEVFVPDHQAQAETSAKTEASGREIHQELRAARPRARLQRARRHIRPASFFSGTASHDGHDHLQLQTIDRSVLESLNLRMTEHRVFARVERAPRGPS